MRTALGEGLAALVEDTDDRAASPGPQLTAGLWQAGRRRRRRANLRSLVAAGLAVAALAFVVWPGIIGPPPVAEAVPAAAPVARTYPSVVAQPHLPPSALDAHRPMAAGYLAAQTLFVVDDEGQSWELPDATGFRYQAALSPDGAHVTDGWALHDLVDGRSRSLGGTSGLPEETVRYAAGWSPDSARFLVLTNTRTDTAPDAVGGLDIAVGTADGALTALPTVPTPDASGVSGTGRVAWLDDSRVLLVIPAAPRPADATRGGALEAYTWTVGGRDWQPAGTLRLPVGASLPVAGALATSATADGRVALTVEFDGQRDPSSASGFQPLTWVLPSSVGAEAQPRAAAAPSNLTVDGLTWRGADLVVSRGGTTEVAGSGQVLSEAVNGSGRPITWRDGAFEGEPYLNSLAVWRDRLFVWTVLLGSLVLIAVGIRVLRPHAARAGLLGERYASPFPIEARWIWS